MSQIHESINRQAFSRHLNPMRAVEAVWQLETLRPQQAAQTACTCPGRNGYNPNCKIHGTVAQKQAK